jgi:hypothetical protein
VVVAVGTDELGGFKLLFIEVLMAGRTLVFSFNKEPFIPILDQVHDKTAPGQTAFQPGA